MSTEKKLNKSGTRRGLGEGSRATQFKKGDGRWKPGESGNPAGKKKSRVKELLEGCLTARQVRENTNLNQDEINAIEKIVLSLDVKSLNAIAKNESTPAYMLTLARAVLLDMKNGHTRTVNLLRDRQFGAVKKNVDVTTNGQSVMQQSLTPSEAKELLKSIEKEY